MQEPIRVRQEGAAYRVEFAGNKHQFNEYMKALGAVANKRFDFKEKNWVVDKKGLMTLRRELGNTELGLLLSAPMGHHGAASAVSSGPLLSHLKFPLYGYQEEIVRFCVDSPHRCALIVAACGAGKTPIGISLLSELIAREQVQTPGLFVVKASLKYQWQREFEKFSDLKAVVIRTPQDIQSSYQDKIRRRERKLIHCSDPEPIRQEILQLEKEARLAFLRQFDGVNAWILNYETLRNNEVKRELHRRKPEFIFPDEIHYVSNRAADRSKALYEFAQAKYKFGATATPVNKNPEDIFGIFSFLNPLLYPKHSQFASLYIKYAGFGKISSFKNLHHLRDKIAPYLVVKSKEEISSQLPRLFVNQRWCELEPEQLEMTEQLLSEIDELRNEERSIRATLRSEAEAMNNQRLIEVSNAILARQTFCQELAVSEQLLLASPTDLAKKYVTGCKKDNKLDLALELIEEIIDSGEKVTVFSRFERLQDILAAKLAKAKINGKIARVHGGITAKQRMVEVYDKFRDDPEYKILLCSDAGAEGLNLSCCKYILETDLAESHGRQTQRHGRIERADSVHDTVFVYQLMAKDSWDEIAQKIVDKKEGYSMELIHAQ